MDIKTLGRKHLESRLSFLRDRPDLERPPRGWIRAVREALGMTTRQFADRLGRAQSVVIEMEKSEARDTLSLARLREAAQALDCTLVYALVPNRPIDDILRARAELIAAEQLERVSHTMALENQSLGRSAYQAERERLAEELLRGPPARLWDDK